MDPALLASLGPGPADSALQEDIQLCPMLDGSLSAYLSMWDRQEQQQQQQEGGEISAGAAAFDPSAAMGMMEQSGTGAAPAAYQDIWEAMTTGWAGDAAAADLGGDETASYLC